jgi:dihydroflavonol-4-reductase
MATVIVTGAAGHVGANLVRALVARGQRVRALIHRDQRALEGLDVDFAMADLCDLDSLIGAFKGAELVYHAAAYISLLEDEWPRLEAVNILGTRNVVEACLQCGVPRLIHFSSIETLLGEPSSEPVDESRIAAMAPHHTPYARSKVAAEREIRRGLACGLDAVILYPSAIIGPHDYRLGFPNSGLLAILKGRLWALVDGGFDWAEEIVGIRAPRLVFPLWLARIGAPSAVALGRWNGGRPLYTPVALEPLGGNYHIRHDRATHDLDYHPRPLKETIVDTWHWFENQGSLPFSGDDGQEAR